MEKTMNSSNEKTDNETLLLKEIILKKDDEIFQLKSIFNVIPGDIYWKNKNGVYLGINTTGSKSLRKMGFTWKESDIVGKTDYDLYDKNTASEFRENDLLIMETRSIQTKEETAILPSGKKITQLSTKRPLFNKNGEVIGIIGNTIDITDKKEAEEREKIVLLDSAEAKAQAEEQLRQVVMILTGSIAHDLRTPITVLEMKGGFLENYLPILINGYDKAVAAQLITEGDKSIPSRMKDHLMVIAKAMRTTTREMHEFIDSTLKTLSKVTTHDITQNDLTTCSMWHCIHNTLRRYPFSEGQRDLIEWDEQDFKFKGDGLMMIRVLFNLIKNSLEQIKKNQGGQITISTGSDEQVNIIRFKDTAGGAPPEVIEHLFAGYKTSKEKGTGVGLAFCKIAIETFDGTITCQSVYSEYIEFTLSFPKIVEEK
jgi:PAS domain S-box-containing protein